MHLVMLRVCSRTVIGGTVLLCPWEEDETEISSPGARSQISGDVPSELNDLDSSRLSLLHTERLEESAFLFRKLMSKVKSRSSPDQSSSEFFSAPSSDWAWLFLRTPSTNSASYTDTCSAPSARDLKRILGEGRLGYSTLGAWVWEWKWWDPFGWHLQEFARLFGIPWKRFAPWPFCKELLWAEGFDRTVNSRGDLDHFAFTLWSAIRDLNHGTMGNDVLLGTSHRLFILPEAFAVTDRRFLFVSLTLCCRFLRRPSSWLESL